LAVPPPVFSPEQVERARRYHRPRYLAMGLGLALDLATLAVLAAVATWTFGPWWLNAAVLAAFAVVATTIVTLPVSYWSSYRREHEWGFSTQSPRSWAMDIFKKVLVGSTISAAGVVALVGLARAFPSWWPAAAAPLAALAVLGLGFVAPIVLEPLFNRFEPLADEAIADDLRGLADRARVPIRDVLVADASRRTTKVNAYVSGLGSTRRVVLYDTLLGRSTRPELRLVVAHELGHRRLRHPAKATGLAMLGAVVAVVVLWAVLPDPADPTVAALVLLVLAVLELVSLPFGTALSRRWERQADHFSLELTGDRDAFVAVHRELATANLADLDPPRWLYRLLFTHPTPPERIASAG
jgi:STE24 endopeptidase